jgi:endo-1,4-beta-xylanase
MLNFIIRNTFIAVLVCAIAACGGGGGGGSKKSTAASSAAAMSSSLASSAVASSVAPSTVGMKAVTPAGLRIGVALKTGYVSTTVNHDIVEKHFNEIVLENDMKMQYLEPSNNVFTFANADKYVDYTIANGMTFHGHVLVWHSQIPDFMKSFSGTPVEYQALLTNHVTRVAAHFAGKMKSWDVVNEALGDSGVYRTDPESFHYVNTGNSIDFIAQAFKDARAADQMADLYYADYSIEQNGTKTNNLITLLDVLKAADAPVTGVSFQMHINQDFPSISSMKAAWGKIVARNLKVKITELDIPLNNGFCGQTTCPFNVLEFTPIVAQAQSKRYCQVVEAYLAAVPEAQRGGISVWGVRDSESWLLGVANWKTQNKADWPLLFDGAGAEKPAVEGVRAALQGQPCI